MHAHNPNQLSAHVLKVSLKGDLHPQKPAIWATKFISYPREVEYVRKSRYKRSNGQLDTKNVWDLTGEDKNSHSCGVTRHQRLWQEDAHKAHLEASHHKLHAHVNMEKVRRWRGKGGMRRWGWERNWKAQWKNMHGKISDTFIIHNYI